MTFKAKILDREYELMVRKTLYFIGKRTRLDLIDTSDGFPILTATINVPNEELSSDEVVIKNYSENYGLYNLLVKNGIVSEYVRLIDKDLGKPVCKLLI